MERRGEAVVEEVVRKYFRPTTGNSNERGC